MLYNLTTTNKLYCFPVKEHTMRAHHYETSSGKDLILGYILSLSYAEKIDGLSVLEFLKNNKLDELNIKPWHGKVWEVYFFKHNRIFYVTIEGQDIYLLHACKKQKNKTEKNDKNIVIKRAKELGVLLSKKII